jgi:hypothetical protein
VRLSDCAAADLPDHELRKEAESIAEQVVFYCTGMMIHTTPLSTTIATKCRDWMVRCQVILWYLRYDFSMSRDDVWSMLVELRHLVHIHLPNCKAELEEIRVHAQAEHEEERNG